MKNSADTSISTTDRDLTAEELKQMLAKAREENKSLKERLAIAEEDLKTYQRAYCIIKAEEIRKSRPKLTREEIDSLIEHGETLQEVIDRLALEG